VSDPVAQRTADLSALVDRFVKRELSIVEVIMKAYSMGHDDATTAWNRANEMLSKALGVTLPELPKVKDPP
jgi:hypothetical protein